jgi:hypothetical protein
MIYRTIQKNYQGAYVVGAWVECSKYGEFYHIEVFYGYAKRYAVKLFNDSLKKQGLKYAK